MGLSGAAALLLGIVVGLAAACGQPARVPARSLVPTTLHEMQPPLMVTELPVIAKLSGPTPVVLRGRIDERRRGGLIREATGVYSDVARRFLSVNGTTHPAVQVCVFEDEVSYREFVAQAFGVGRYSSLGFYRADVRVAVVNLARGVGNLRHELVHPLLGDDFPTIPAWLNEGIGALYGSSRVRNGHVTFLVNYRLRDLHRALRRGEAPDFGGLVRSTGKDVRGPRAAVYYATARYLLLYLDRRGRLDAFYRTVRDKHAGSDAMLELLEQTADENHFLAWARKLRYLR